MVTHRFLFSPEKAEEEDDEAEQNEKDADETLWIVPWMGRNVWD